MRAGDRVDLINQRIENGDFRNEDFLWVLVTLRRVLEERDRLGQKLLVIQENCKHKNETRDQTGAVVHTSCPDCGLETLVI